MKRGWMVLLLLIGFAVPAASHAQVSAYGEFSATRYFGTVEQDYFYGVSAGVLIDGPQIFHKILVSADIQGRFVGSNGEHLNGVTVGPRLTLPWHRAKLNPYGEFLVGFARYNDGHNNKSTDDIFEVNAGVTRQLTPRWDGVFEYSYSQYGFNGGEFNPKTFSIGAVYHFVKR
jgi:opacity protein-like surface antigen